jgi:flagellar biosynthesis protein FlhB
MSAAKTEQPTAKRLRDARGRGEVPKSRDFSAALVLVSAALGLGFVAGPLGSAFERVMRQVLLEAARPSATRLLPTLAYAAGEAASVLAPLLALLVVVAGAVAFVQVGPVFAPGAVMPKWSRLSPTQFGTRLVGREQWIELAKATLKGIVVGWMAVAAIEAVLPLSAGLMEAEPRASLALIARTMSALLLRGAVVLLAFGALDFFYQRWRFVHDQRMTKDEVRREHRESEGDPHAKAARDRAYGEMLAQAALSEVRRADVLVVNPTHYAVALRYEQTEDAAAPEVLAKGQDLLALRMIDAAREAGVPILRDVPLAHALFELGEGEVIPEELYEAVAIVLRAAWAERDTDGEGQGDSGSDEPTGGTP